MGLSNRLNAVVLSGEALLPKSSSEDVVTLRFIYRIARNATPRTALPEKFRIFDSVKQSIPQNSQLRVRSIQKSYHRQGPPFKRG